MLHEPLMELRQAAKSTSRARHARRTPSRETLASWLSTTSPSRRAVAWIVAYLLRLADDARGLPEGLGGECFSRSPRATELRRSGAWRLGTSRWRCASCTRQPKRSVVILPPISHGPCAHEGVVW